VWGRKFFCGEFAAFGHVLLLAGSGVLPVFDLLILLFGYMGNGDCGGRL
jgi:hypothetical protein